jgi:hypothetical protein
MEQLIGVVAVICIFGGGASFLLAVSPIGRAIADRIRSRTAHAGDERIQDLLEAHDALADEVEAMRTDLTDLQERLDFTERLLTHGRDQGTEPGGHVKN